MAALKEKNKRRIRWHPMYLRWCLNLSRVSSEAYEVIKESGIHLPNRHILNDYTHWVSAQPGFQHEVDEFLMTEAKVKELKEWERHS